MIEIDEGQMWEAGPWKLATDHECTSYGGGRPCRHSHSIAPAAPRRRADGRLYNHSETVWIVPRIVIAENEGGHNSTGVCADCIVEALAASG